MRDRLLVPTLVFLGLVVTAVSSLGAPLLPTIGALDHVSLAGSQWTLTISLLAGAVAAPVMGRLGDGSRRRATILLGLVAVIIGCALAALPLGFPLLVVGRGLQGIGLGLAPLAIATARDALSPERAQPAIALLSVTTAAGLGVGYPLAGLIAEHLGLGAAFWFGALLGAAALGAGAFVLPPSPDRPVRRADTTGALVLAAAITGLLLVLSEGETWGWTSPAVLGCATGALVALGAWVRHELRVPQPLVDLRLLARPAVLAADATILLVGVGIYPLLSLVSRLVQTPASSGYGLGASVVGAGLALVPFSVGSYVASRVALVLLARMAAARVVVLSCVTLIAAMTTFLLARQSWWEVLTTMALAGLGVGGVFAANPQQIIRGVPATQTASAMSFNQVLRYIGFSAGSALSATVLDAYTSAPGALPSSAGYGAAAVVSIGVLCAALGAVVAFARRAGRVPGAVLASAGARAGRS